MITCSSLELTTVYSEGWLKTYKLISISIVSIIINISRILSHCSLHVYHGLYQADNTLSNPKRQGRDPSWGKELYQDLHTVRDYCERGVLHFGKSANMTYK